MIKIKKEKRSHILEGQAHVSMGEILLDDKIRVSRVKAVQDSRGK